LFELRSMLRAKKKKKEEKGYNTSKISFFFFFTFPSLYLPAKQTCHN